METMVIETEAACSATLTIPWVPWTFTGAGITGSELLAHSSVLLEISTDPEGGDDYALH